MKKIDVKKHPELSNSLSVTSVFMGWISNKKIEEVYKASSLDEVKAKVVSDLSEIVGKGLSSESFNKYKNAILGKKKINDLSIYMANVMLAGDNLYI